MKLPMAPTVNNDERTAGCIRRIALRNFLTYNAVEIYPVAGLNLITGPNGSGKSSIVSGICLGLGGKSEFTGRQIKIADFIQHGCSSAEIEIELDDPSSKRNLVIQREIRRNGTSSYKLNRRPATESEVRATISRFNIQVDNMCQFLPQEKVASFSRMNSKMLLDSMLQAVGDQNMYENYKALVQKQKEARGFENDEKKTNELLLKEKEKNSRLQQDVKIYEERQSHLNRIDLLKKQRPLIEYNMILEEVQSQQLVKDTLKKEYEALQLELKPFMVKIGKLEEEACKLRDSGIKLTRLVCTVAAEIDQTKRRIAHQDDEIKSVKMALNGKLQDAAEQKSRIQNLEVMIKATLNERQELTKEKDSKLANHMQNIEDKKAVIAEEGQIMIKRKELVDAEESLQHSANRLVKFLKEMEDKNHIKLENLKRLDQDAFRAFQWLQNNRNKFRKHVYDPIMILIDVSSSDNAKYLENHIALRDLVVFLCEDREDAKLFTELLREKMKIPVNCAPMPNRSVEDYQPSVSLNMLRQKYRFVDYLKNLFTAPDAVMAYLCDLYFIHNTPVGDMNTERSMTETPKDFPFRKYFTPNYSFTVKTSKYGNREVSTQSFNIRKKGFFVSDPHAGLKENKKAELKEVNEKLHDLQRKCKELDRETIKLRESLKPIKDAEDHFNAIIQKINQCSNIITQKRNMLAATKHQKIDVELEKTLAKNKVDELSKKKLELLGKFEADCRKQLKAERERMNHLQALDVACKKKSLLQKNYHSASDKLEEKKNEFAEAKMLFKELKDKQKDILRKAEETCGVRLNETSEVSKLTQNMPLNIEALEQEINQLNAKVNCMCNSDPGAIEEYKRRKKNIKNSEAELTQLRQSLQSLKDDIEQIRIRWLTPFENLVDKISSTFSKYFQLLGCAGEVIISKGNNDQDYENYGLSIRVKYRDEAPLRELSQSHHSGGECSVATIVFILSLQELTEVPFRCVDEINQGMDAVNERRVFELVSASAEKSSQYFLLTPKLLKDLEYSENIKIHFIHNGPTNLVSKWNMREFIQSRKNT